MLKFELSPDELARYKAEVIAAAKREAEWESDEEYLILQFKEMEEYGHYSGEEMLDMLDGKPVFSPPWY